MAILGFIIGLFFVSAIVRGRQPRKTAEELEAAAAKKNSTIDKIALALFIFGIGAGVPLFVMMKNAIGQ